MHTTSFAFSSFKTHIIIIQSYLSLIPCQKLLSFSSLSFCFFLLKVSELKLKIKPKVALVHVPLLNHAFSSSSKLKDQRQFSTLSLWILFPFQFQFFYYFILKVLKISTYAA
jgi:hypothetical protein